MGTTIGMDEIKERRLNELSLNSRPGLYVGRCVPFYFCPRSVMLYMIWKKNPKLDYHGGQDPIVHLEAILHQGVAWAERNGRRWAFTLPNAGSNHFEDRSDLAQLGQINWDAVGTHRWSGRGIPPEVMDGKQAEFLIEQSFPWELVSRVGVSSQQAYGHAKEVLKQANHRPRLAVMRTWYYRQGGTHV